MATSQIAPAQAIDRAVPPVAESPDIAERVEQFIGKWAFGFGADLLPYLGRREVQATRLVSRLLHAAVDRRTWPVRCVCTCVHRDVFVSTIESVCVCIYVCVYMCVYH
jgi:hypothetical protein